MYRDTRVGGCTGEYEIERDVGQRMYRKERENEWNLGEKEAE